MDFLRRFYFDQLGLSLRTTQLVKDMLMLQETPRRFSGKTGWAGLGEEGQPQTGWLIGYLEQQGKVFFLAPNIDIKRKTVDRQFQKTGNRT